MGILSVLIQVIRCDYAIMLSMCGLCNYYSHGFSSQILAPFVYGFLYVRMVAIYPPMIFFAFATAISTSFCILSFIKISKGKEYYRQYLTDLEESELNKESSTRRPHEGTWTFYTLSSLYYSNLIFIYSISFTGCLLKRYEHFYIYLLSILRHHHPCPNPHSTSLKMTGTDADGPMGLQIIWRGCWFRVCQVVWHWWDGPCRI